MSALFHFSSLLTVILLLICTCAYIRSIWPSLLDRRKTGPLGTFWKFARIGERLSPYVAVFCIGMAFHTLFIQWKYFPIQSAEYISNSETNRLQNTFQIQIWESTKTKHGESRKQSKNPQGIYEKKQQTSKIL